MQKCQENKQDTNEKMSKENEGLKKEMININLHLHLHMKSPEKLRNIIILKKK